MKLHVARRYANQTNELMHLTINWASFDIADCLYVMKCILVAIVNLALWQRADLRSDVAILIRTNYGG